MDVGGIGNSQVRAAKMPAQGDVRFNQFLELLDHEDLRRGAVRGAGTPSSKPLLSDAAFAAIVDLLLVVLSFYGRLSVARSCSYETLVSNRPGALCLLAEQCGRGM
ncbi:hypothetical protein GCM10007928_30810 [Sulfitobacter porphyrae]|nr:hypothetical protein GCM10007928_30810 [Sulfitobacter porphyrae]